MLTVVNKLLAVSLKCIQKAIKITGMFYLQGSNIQHDNMRGKSTTRKTINITLRN